MWYTAVVRRFLVGMMLVFGLGIGVRAASAEPPDTHEILTNRPSGFWTSNRPAIGGAYRYRLLGLGVVIAGVTGFFVVRALRRANAERAGRA